MEILWKRPHIAFIGLDSGFFPQHFHKLASGVARALLRVRATRDAGAVLKNAGGGMASLPVWVGREPTQKCLAKGVDKAART